MQEWGADVIKIELPGFGDQSRWLPIARGDRRAAFFTAYNRGKRSMTIDLRVPKGRDVFLRLVEQRRRRDHQLQARDDGRVGPRLRRRGRPATSGSSTPWGPRSGPRGPTRRGKAPTSARQAAGGLISTTGGKGADPERDRRHHRRPHRGPEPPLGHPGGAVRAGAHGTWAAGRDLAARRPALGPGRRVHAVPPVGEHLGPERPEPPHDPGHLRRVPDRRRVDRHRRHRGTGPRSLLPDHRPARPDRAVPDAPVLRGRQGRALWPILDEVFATKPTAEWCELLGAAGLRFAPVRDHAEVAADPGVRANGYIASVEDPDDSGTGHRGGPGPVRFSDPLRRPAPVRPSWASTPRRSCSRPATPGTTSRACPGRRCHLRSRGDAERESSSALAG